ncbi:MAG: formylglycine-generating enzyme family protein [Treponema sp.]|nr:formylglycine-generating enzyme family protein [Treponema sp.]
MKKTFYLIIMVISIISASFVSCKNATEAAGNTQEIYSANAELSCFVTAMGGQEFGAPVYKGLFIVKEVDGSYNAIVLTGKGEGNIFGISFDAFIDSRISSPGYYDFDGKLVSADYIISENDTAEAAANPYYKQEKADVKYVTALKFPVNPQVSEYKLWLYINSNVMGVQFCDGNGDSSSSHPGEATPYVGKITINWNSLKATDEEVPDFSKSPTKENEKTFVLLPSGSFMMGSEKGSTRGPVHKVILTRSFYICDHEVTQKEYKEIMGALTSKLEELGEESRGGYGDDYPMNCVHWFHEIEYCNKRSIKENFTPCYEMSIEAEDGSVTKESNPYNWPAYSEWGTISCNWNADGYRLPTSAEWEYAARAGDETTDILSYSGTSNIDELSEYAWWGENSVSAAGAYDASAKEVKTRKPNAWGLYDMSGNVRERCWDLMTGWGYSSAETVTDPTGGEENGYQSTIMRGGAYNDYNGKQCSTADFFYQPFGSWLEWDGFRVVRTATNK